MTDTTLTDFLLARIAEDEAVATYGGGAHGGIVWNAFGGIDQPETVWVRSRWDTARVLAECEAKRRIVVGLASLGGETSYGGEAMESWKHIAKMVVANLALPYADHPDYRDEWRP